MATTKTKTETNNSLLTEEPKSIIDFPLEPQVEEKPANVVLKLRNYNGHGTYNWHCEEMAYDPIKKEYRKMRLLKNCPTIWQDEQANYTDLKWNEKNIRYIEFFNGVAVIPSSDEAAVNYFTYSGNNWDNPKRDNGRKQYFTVWNPIAEAMEQAKEENLLMEAMHHAATAPLEEMKRHSVYLGISLANVLGMRKTEKELRIDYMKKAKVDPAKFLKGVGNPEVDYNWAVKVLVTNGEIDLHARANQALWNDGGFICAIPEGTDPMVYLTSFATLATEESRNFAQKLKQLAKL
jgi:hypothetical protein